ncbi:MAG TPA: hypothetical protein VNA13_00375 [Xanthomonadales bacterium]|nr:hypothetical protein [Xanthomonadales bacterium]
MKKRIMKKKEDKTVSEETKHSLENGKKMIQVQKKLTPGNADKKEEEEKKDAEEWRNEG